MLRNLFACIALLICIFGSAYGEEKKEVVRFNVGDFYFYDEANLIQRLILVPKIMVNFFKQLSDEDRMAFFNKFPSAHRQKDPSKASRYILEFPVPVSEQRLMETLTEINSSDIAEGISIVLIDNVEAIAQGFVVEPRTPLAPGMLGKRLQKIGAFSVRQVAPEGHGWLFVVDDIKPPLHIYPLINLIHNDPWVKSARPKFQFLHPAIVSRIEVSPVSGTVDETRTVTLSVRVFDPEIKILTNLLPNFGEGKFQPSPVPAPLFFFPAVGKRESPEELSDARGRVVSLQWRFRLFTPGEWTIPPQTIHYERKGEKFTITSVQTPFVVTSLIGSLAINDMPSPRLLPVPGKTSDAVPVQTPPLFPSHWFDRWISEISAIARTSFIAAIVLGIIGIGMLIVWGVEWWGRKMERELDIEIRIRAWQTACHNANEDVSLASYKKLEVVLWDVLFAAFPDELPRSPDLKNVEVHARDAFDDDQWHDLCMLYEELESVHARNFMPEQKTLNEIAERLLGLIYYLTPMIGSKRKD